jgi:hypothetical protein
LVPYRVTLDDKYTWEYSNKAGDREYIDTLGNISDNQHLPVIAHNGLVLQVSPHFMDYNEGTTWAVSYTGYLLFKFYNRIPDISKKDITDYPIFRMGEVLVNHAEAAWELGKFTQEVADKTINKLRERGDVAPMLVSGITAGFDPKRDPDVDPVLWEIRRERAVELMAEGFRFDDLRRWKKMDYTGEEKLGRWIRSEDVNGRIPIQGNAQEGYISYLGTPPPFPDYYYLYPIPGDQIALNPEIKQNPGW